MLSSLLFRLLLIVGVVFISTGSLIVYWEWMNGKHMLMDFVILLSATVSVAIWASLFARGRAKSCEGARVRGRILLLNSPAVTQGSRRRVFISSGYAHPRTGQQKQIGGLLKVRARPGKSRAWPGR